MPEVCQIMSHTRSNLELRNWHTINLCSLPLHPVVPVQPPATRPGPTWKLQEWIKNKGDEHTQVQLPRKFYHAHRKVMQNKPSFIVFCIHTTIGTHWTAINEFTFAFQESIKEVLCLARLKEQCQGQDLISLLNGRNNQWDLPSTHHLLSCLPQTRNNRLVTVCNGMCSSYWFTLMQPKSTLRLLHSEFNRLNRFNTHQLHQAYTKPPPTLALPPAGDVVPHPRWASPVREQQVSRGRDQLGLDQLGLDLMSRNDERSAWLAWL